MSSVDERIFGGLGGPENKIGGKLTLSTSSSQTSEVGSSTVDIISDTDCFIEFGSDPTAVVDSSYYLAAGATYRLAIQSESKIAAITSSGSGSLWWHGV